MRIRPVFSPGKLCKVTANTLLVQVEKESDLMILEENEWQIEKIFEFKIIQGRLKYKIQRASRDHNKNPDHYLASNSRGVLI